MIQKKNESPLPSFTLKKGLINDVMSVCSLVPLCVSHLQVRSWNVCRMSSTFVTLAEVLEARGGPLLEEEVWSLLLGTAEALVDVSYKGKELYIILLFFSDNTYDHITLKYRCKILICIAVLLCVTLL